MKISIKSELIRIACVHTECALTAIRIEFAFSQSTSIGGLKPISYRIDVIASSTYRRVIYCACHYNCAISKSSRIERENNIKARAIRRQVLWERTASILYKVS